MRLSFKVNYTMFYRMLCDSLAVCWINTGRERSRQISKEVSAWLSVVSFLQNESSVFFLKYDYKWLKVI